MCLSYLRQAGLVFLALVTFDARAALPPWTLELDSLGTAAAQIEGVRISGNTAPGGESAVQVEVEKLLAGQSSEAFGPFRATCPGEFFAVFENLCGGGTWTLRVLADWPELQGRLNEARYSGGQLMLRTEGRLDQLAWSARLELLEGDLQLNVTLPDQGVSALSLLHSRLPALSWLTEGRFRGSATMSLKDDEPVDSGLSVQIEGLGFDSPDGLFAGAAVAAQLEARLDQGAWDAAGLTAEISGGELLLADFYRDFSDRGMKFEARARVHGDVLTVTRATLGDGDALHLAGEGRLALGDDATPPEILLREFSLVFPAAYDRYMESLAAVWLLDGLETGGTVRWAGDWSPGNARSGRLVIEDF
ncbi:MAG: hypothetical protein R3212_09270, partial [Xanthomonadales bacterium]|nr:hypothetical protein [Xanthomonadales bacterium]